jgi:hypothetical protein
MKLVVAGECEACKVPFRFSWVMAVKSILREAVIANPTLFHTVGLALV